MLGGGFDLAAVASAAGLGGGAISAVAALMFFKGFFVRIFTQMVMTAVLTGIGFLTLLNALGFEIVPRDNPQAAALAPLAGANDLVTAQSFDASKAAPADTGKRTYYIKSPFRS